MTYMPECHFTYFLRLVGGQQLCGRTMRLCSRNKQKRLGCLYQKSLDTIEHDRSKNENMRRWQKQEARSEKQESRKRRGPKEKTPKQKNKNKDHDTRPQLSITRIYRPRQKETHFLYAKELKENGVLGPFRPLSEKQQTVAYVLRFGSSRGTKVIF